MLVCSFLNVGGGGAQISVGGTSSSALFRALAFLLFYFRECLPIMYWGVINQGGCSDFGTTLGGGGA